MYDPKKQVGVVQIRFFVILYTSWVCVLSSISCRWEVGVGEFWAVGDLRPLDVASVGGHINEPLKQIWFPSFQVSMDLIPRMC